MHTAPKLLWDQMVIDMCMHDILHIQIILHIIIIYSAYIYIILHIKTMVYYRNSVAPLFKFDLGVFLGNFFFVFTAQIFLGFDPRKNPWLTGVVGWSGEWCTPLLNCWFS